MYVIAQTACFRRKNIAASTELPQKIGMSGGQQGKADHRNGGFLQTDYLESGKFQRPGSRCDESASLIGSNA